MRLLLASLLLVLAACSSMQATEDAQLAYAGKGPNPCLFGGVTPAAERHCREVKEGLIGFLRSVNAEAMRRSEKLPRGSACQAHVAAVRSALWERDDLVMQSIFSCPFADACHVSALITTSIGERYVLDNGVLQVSGQIQDGVGSFKQFVDRTRGHYWFYPPSSEDIASLSVPTVANAAPALLIAATPKVHALPALRSAPNGPVLPSMMTHLPRSKRKPATATPIAVAAKDSAKVKKGGVPKGAAAAAADLKKSEKAATAADGKSQTPQTKASAAPAPPQTKPLLRRR